MVKDKLFYGLEKKFKFFLFINIIYMFDFLFWKEMIEKNSYSINYL